ITKNRKNIATIQGAGTGIGGIFTLSLDIPFLLGLQLKTLQDIAICYGYDPNDKKERLFIIKSLQFISSDIVGKQVILAQLSKFDSQDEETKREVVSELQGWREVVLSYRDQFGWKKMFQMIPIAGLVFGAFINRSAINDIGEAGMMLYRKRRIVERLNKDNTSNLLN
ncbi:MAG: EcsC family protein, partial [Psychrobacillus psychrotolerans]